MTGFIVDTHVMLWWADSEDRLTPEARLVMGAGRNELFFSIASVWELNIKMSKKQVELPDSIDVMLQRARCKLLPIAYEHAEAIKELPHLHRDPFDRMLIAQAKVTGMTLLTRDEKIHKYDVPVIAA